MLAHSCCTPLLAATVAAVGAAVAMVMLAVGAPEQYCGWRTQAQKEFCGVRMAMMDVSGTVTLEEASGLSIQKT